MLLSVIGIVLCNSVYASSAKEFINHFESEDYSFNDLPSYVLKVKDGDTFTVLVHSFPGQFELIEVRLINANTPETGNGAVCEEERELALSITSQVRELIEGKTVFLSSLTFQGGFGRYLAEVVIDDKKLSKLLLEQGKARIYDKGQWRDGYWCELLND